MLTRTISWTIAFSGLRAIGDIAESSAAIILAAAAGIPFEIGDLIEPSFNDATMPSSC